MLKCLYEVLLYADDDDATLVHDANTVSLAVGDTHIAILRSVGARPAHVFALLMSEAAVLAVVGVLVGVALNQMVLALARPAMQQRYGVLLESVAWSISDAVVLLIIIGAALLTGAIPAWQAYRRTLADGLVIRL